MVIDNGPPLDGHSDTTRGTAPGNDDLAGDRAAATGQVDRQAPQLLRR